MKTKIIYISSSKSFNTLEIQAAFDEVRKTLALPADTVLFGVPLEDEVQNTIPNNIPAEPYTDIQDEIAKPDVNESVAPASEPVFEPEFTPEINISAAEDITNDFDITSTVNTEDFFGPEDDTDDIITATDDDFLSSDDDEEIIEIIDSSPDFPEINPTAEDKVIPILSILSAKSEEINDISEFGDDIITEVVQDIIDEAETIEEVIESADDFDLPENDLPEYAPVESSIESIFEKMKPLQDDVNVTATEPVHKTEPATQTKNMFNDESDISKNLEKLAAEFQKNQKVQTKSEPKPESNGKISKLKNILPFKKSKQNDSGSTLSSLFDWAGVAANDDDFPIPSYFPSTGK